jgi:hypothetical protein
MGIIKSPKMLRADSSNGSKIGQGLVLANAQPARKADGNRVLLDGLAKSKAISFDCPLKRSNPKSQKQDAGHPYRGDEMESGTPAHLATITTASAIL